jgi:GntR family transcriptional regulator
MADPLLDLASEGTGPGVPLVGPLYKDVKRQLMEALTRGEWKPGEAIPSERRIAERFGISIGTVRKAIDELVAENILIRQQGRGTFVATHTRDRLLFYFFHIVPEQGPKEYPEVELLSFVRAKAERGVADRLQIEAGDPVLRIRNALRLAGKRMIIDDITVSAQRFPGLSEKRFRERPSTIYNLYQDFYGISVVRSSERLRAVAADAEIAQLLGIAPGAPLLQIRRIALAYNDLPVEFRISQVNTAGYEYFSDLGRS